MRSDTGAWLQALIGRTLGRPDLYGQALTHGSAAAANYERLEFLGDRVLGLVIADWLFDHFPTEPEGKLSRRFNALVSGETCAEVARGIGLPQHLVLGKQARDDGATDSDNVLGDVMEAIIGALFLDAGWTLPKPSCGNSGQAASIRRTPRPGIPNQPFRNGPPLTAAVRPNM